MKSPLYILTALLPLAIQLANTSPTAQPDEAEDSLIEERDNIQDRDSCQVGRDEFSYYSYRSSPNWGDAVRQLTPNQAGVDYVMDIGGTDTLEQSQKCIKMEGIINLTGLLGASDKSQPGLLRVLSHIYAVRGLYVGSCALLKGMVQASEANGIHPVLDEAVFDLDQGREAFEIPD
ncbi:hypothetical protein BBP40_000550 [Aspergillus hancockii]|nr:hypothetical protein BBP40_000550 [Aspergillus hancockii]